MKFYISLFKSNSTLPQLSPFSQFRIPNSLVLRQPSFVTRHSITPGLQLTHLSQFRIPISLRGRFQPVAPVRLTGRRVGPYGPYGPEAAFQTPSSFRFCQLQAHEQPGGPQTTPYSHQPITNKPKQGGRFQGEKGNPQACPQTEKNTNPQKVSDRPFP